MKSGKFPREIIDDLAELLYQCSDGAPEDEMCGPWTAEQMNSMIHDSRDAMRVVACLLMPYIDNLPERMAAWRYENKLSGDVLDLENSDDAVESELESLTAKRDCIELHFA